MRDHVSACRRRNSHSIRTICDRNYNFLFPAHQFQTKEFRQTFRQIYLSPRQLQNKWLETVTFAVIARHQNFKTPKFVKLQYCPLSWGSSFLKRFKVDSISDKDKLVQLYAEMRVAWFAAHQLARHVVIVVERTIHNFFRCLCISEFSKRFMKVQHCLNFMLRSSVANKLSTFPFHRPMRIVRCFSLTELHLDRDWFQVHPDILWEKVKVPQTTWCCLECKKVSVASTLIGQKTWLQSSFITPFSDESTLKYAVVF